MTCFAFPPPARTILSWAGRPQNNSAAEGVLRDLCAPIGPSIATLARGRGPDYARAAVGRVPQVRVQSLHYYLNAVSGPSGRASALPLHNPNLHTVMSLCAGLSVCFSDRATRIFSGSRMSPRGLKTAKIKGLGASAVLRAPLRNPGVLTLLLASLRDSTARSDCARGRLEEAREEPASAPALGAIRRARSLIEGTSTKRGKRRINETWITPFR